MARCLSQLALTLSIPKCKHAFLALLSGAAKSEGGLGPSGTNYEAFFLTLVSELLRSNTNHGRHMPSQEMLLGAIQNLLDIEIVLDFSEKYSLQNLVSASSF